MVVEMESEDGVGNGSNNLQNLSKEKENSKKSKMLSVKEEKIIKNKNKI
jgi:hypothetical protein